jgi:hypothetical protein
MALTAYYKFIISIIFIQQYLIFVAVIISFIMLRILLYTFFFHFIKYAIDFIIIISASAFAYGLFEGTGFLGSCGYQPVDILSTGKEKDIFLRFFDTCQVYKELHES